MSDYFLILTKFVTAIPSPVWSNLLGQSRVQEPIRKALNGCLESFPMILTGSLLSIWLELESSRLLDIITLMNFPTVLAKVMGIVWFTEDCQEKWQKWLLVELEKWHLWR